MKEGGQIRAQRREWRLFVGVSNSFCDQSYLTASKNPRDELSRLARGETHNRILANRVDAGL